MLATSRIQTTTKKTIQRVIALVFACHAAWFVLLAKDSTYSRQLGQQKPPIQIGKIIPEEENAAMVAPRLSGEDGDQLFTRKGANEVLRQVLERSTANNLVVYNALGKRHNLALVEHSRRTAFKPDEWDCVGFMFAKEDRIPDDDPHLRRLIDELGCAIPRTPGLFWGDFLQFITPTFVANYDYIALHLDDIFIPDQGPNKFNSTKFLDTMKKHDIDIMQPGMIGGSRNPLNTAHDKGLDGCVTEVNLIETYVEVFTRDAWECYFKMLHYTGSRGWCYDICIRTHCPDFRQAFDLSMLAWHMDRKLVELPQDLIAGTGLEEWAPEPKILENGYQEKGGGEICVKLKCPGIPKEEFTMEKIECPASAGVEVSIASQ